MKTLVLGGIKSGKSAFAQKYILDNTSSKPIYLATSEFIDDEMSERILEHKKNRKDSFITFEEPLKIKKIINNAQTYVLVECVSMWINNMLYHQKPKDKIFKTIKEILSLDKDIVFVLNDVSCSVIGASKEVREFVDVNGIVSQILAKGCDEVYFLRAGLEQKLK